MSNIPEHETRPLEKWLVPSIIVLFCIGAFWLSTTFREMPPILKRGIQPSDFPQLILGMITCLTLAMVWLDPIRVRERLKNRTTGTIALFGLFAVTTAIDFMLALSVLAVALSAWWGERRISRLAIVGLAIPLIIFFLFDQVFEIRFPRGLLTNIWYG